MKSFARALGRLTRSTVPAILALFLACDAPAVDPVVAITSREPITASEYAAWLDGHNKTVQADQREANLSSLAIVREFARRFAERPESEEERTRFRIRRLEDQILARALEARVAAKVVVTEEEVARELEKRDAERSQPERVQLNSLFKSADPADPGARRRVREAMESLRQRILSGEDFSALARAESESQTRLRGGRVGILRRGQLPKNLEEVAFSLAEGELSAVLESELGFTLLHVSRILPAHVMPRDEAESRLRRFLEKQAREAGWSGTLAQLRRAIEVSLAADVAIAPDGAAERLVATAGGVTLRRLEFEWILEELPRGSAAPGLDQAEAQLRRWADIQLAAARARALGLIESDPNLASRLVWRRLEFAANEELALATEAALLTPEESALRVRYEAAPDKYTSPARYDSSLLRIPIDNAEPRASALRVVDLARRIRRSEETFGEMALQYSDLPSAAAGGRLGWRTARQLAWTGPAVLGTIQSLRPGETSQPLTQDGWRWLVQLHAKKPAAAVSFAAARTALVMEALSDQRAERREELKQATLAELALEVVASEP